MLFVLKIVIHEHHENTVLDVQELKTTVVTSDIVLTLFMLCVVYFRMKMHRMMHFNIL